MEKSKLELYSFLTHAFIDNFTVYKVACMYVTNGENSFCAKSERPSKTLISCTGHGYKYLMHVVYRWVIDGELSERWIHSRYNVAVVFLMNFKLRNCD